MRWRELEVEQKRGLDYKIAVAIRIIHRAFEVATKVALAFSGGKDSTALLELIRRASMSRPAHTRDYLSRLVVIYGNTGCEFAECVRFARKTAQDLRLDFHEARPGKTGRWGFKYAAQRRIWEQLIEENRIGEVLKRDGKLKSTLSLERACPPDLREELEREGLIWREGTRKSYFWCADQYGWPVLGKAWSRLKARRINIDTFLRYSASQSTDPKLLEYYRILRHVKISQACCDVLKKEPAERVQEQLDVDLIFKGLMASESRPRALNFLTRGYLFEGAVRSYLHGRPFFHCQPMAIWTDADVWASIRRFDVPYASLYDLTYTARDGTVEHIKRNGCIFCATDLRYADNHLYVLRQTHRRAWKTVIQRGLGDQIRNLQRTLRSVPQLALFDAFSTEELIEAQPCVFDDLDGLGGRPSRDDLVWDPEVVTRPTSAIGDFVTT